MRVTRGLLVFVCTKGCMQGMVWTEPDKHESKLHVEGQAQYVERVLQVVLLVVLVCVCGGSVWKGGRG